MKMLGVVYVMQHGNSLCISAWFPFLFNVDYFMLLCGFSFEALWLQLRNVGELVTVTGLL